MTDFSKAVAAWVEQAKARVDHVVQESAHDVFEKAQLPGPSHTDPGAGQGGRMPVVTGQLRDSLTMSINGAPAGSGGDSYKAAAAQMEAGDTLRRQSRSSPPTSTASG